VHTPPFSQRPALIVSETKRIKILAKPTKSTKKEGVVIGIQTPSIAFYCIYVEHDCIILYFITYGSSIKDAISIPFGFIKMSKWIYIYI